MIISGLTTACSGPYSTLDPAAPFTSSVAVLWWGMCIAFTIVLVGLVALWWHATRRDPDSREMAQPDAAHGHWIIGGGIILPVLAITLVLIFGVPAGQRMMPLTGEEDSVLRIDVTARQWRWHVSYPRQGIELENVVHIPAGRAVNVHLHSNDVIHSFWVPRLAGKMDAIPGRTNVMRLSASQAGTFRGHCAEFCGLQHARMQFVVHAHEPSDFESWLNENQESGND